MSVISKPGFEAVIEGKNKRISFKAKFMESTLDLDASIRLAEFCVKYMPMVGMFAPAAKVHLDEAKRHVELAMRDAK